MNVKDKVSRIQTDDLFIEVSPEDLKRLQNALLEIYKDIAEVCRKYDLTPYLVGGSALGAVRHHGFIPWDDDLDIGMTRVDYEKLREVFAAELADRYLLNAPNYSEDPKARFPKIIKKGTACREIVDVHDPRRNGIFLDIFILDDVPENAICRKIKGTICNGLEFISSQVFLKENTTAEVRKMYRRMGWASYLFHYLTGILFSWIPSRNWFHAVDKAVRHSRKSEFVGLPTGRKHYFGEIFRKEELLPAVWVDFEDIKVPIFQGYDMYLRNLYGDYMKIPPEGDRERHYFVELRI